MIQQAINSNDPVVFMEPKRRYWQKGQVNLDGPSHDLHKAVVLRQGTDVTIASYGPMVVTSLQAAEIAQSEGVSIEVIDIRSLSPIDFGVIAESVKKTGRLIVAHEAGTFVSISSEIAAKIAELCFYYLEAPVIRVGGFDVPYPAAKLEELYLPDADRIMEAVDRVMAY
jgi:pyruvate dehydrogenase E1 component beta subunit